MLWPMSKNFSIQILYLCKKWFLKKEYLKEMKLFSHITNMKGRNIWKWLKSGKKSEPFGSRALASSTAVKTTFWQRQLKKLQQESFLSISNAQRYSSANSKMLFFMVTTKNKHCKIFPNYDMEGSTFKEDNNSCSSRSQLQIRFWKCTQRLIQKIISQLKNSLDPI